MAENRVLPLGFIDRITEDGAIIMLTRPSDSHTLRPGTPVTLRSRSRRKPTATARVRGVITGVGHVTAAFSRDSPDQTDFPEHGTLGDKSNYKVVPRTRHCPLTHSNSPLS